MKQLIKHVDRLNKAVHKTAEAAAVLTAFAASSSVQVPLPNSQVPTIKKTVARPAAVGNEVRRTGRPPTSGRFETRGDLVAFVKGQLQRGIAHTHIAKEAGVSRVVIRKILDDLRAAA